MKFKSQNKIDKKNLKRIEKEIHTTILSKIEQQIKESNLTPQEKKSITNSDGTLQSKSPSIIESEYGDPLKGTYGKGEIKKSIEKLISNLKKLE